MLARYRFSHSYDVTAYLENLVCAPFCKKSSASIRQTPQPPMVWDCNRDEGRYWSCTLMHAPIICRYCRPGPLHTCVKELSPGMCAALLNIANESHNKLCQVKALVPVAHTCACSNTLHMCLRYAIT